MRAFWCSLRFKTKGCEGVDEIADKGQNVYNFPKDAVKTEGMEFLIPYDGNHHL